MHQSSAQLLSRAVNGRLVLAITDFEAYIGVIADAIEDGRLREVEVMRDGRPLFRTLPAARPDDLAFLGSFAGSITIRPASTRLPNFGPYCGLKM